MSIKLKLQDYAKIKQSSVNDVIAYALSKDIVLPNDEDYVLDEAILKQIDPILHHNLKFKKSIQHLEVSRTTILAGSKSEVKVSTPPKKQTKRIIGVVQFFDSRTNHFGIILTNALGINKKDSTGKLYALRLNECDWQHALKPEDGDWITITTNFYRGTWVAKKGERLNPDKDGFKLALEYRGEFARIKGQDKKGNRHNYNVICHTYDRILRNNADGKEIILSSFAEYLASFNDECIEGIIQEFLLDNDLCKRLIALLPEMKRFMADDENTNKGLKKLTEYVESSIFEKKDISILASLPADFDFVSNQENVTAVLENCVVDKESEVRRWLENHKDFTNVLMSRTDSLSLDLVYLICNEIHDFSLLYNSNKPWNELYAWAKPKGSSVEWNVFLTYFKNRDEDFVVKCNLQATVDAEFATEIVEQLLEEAGEYSAVLKYMAKAFFADNLPVIETFVTNGVDASHIYEQLTATLSDYSKEQEPEVRSFFKSCKDAGLNIKDIISQNYNLSDELTMELFMQTAEVEFLNRIADFDKIPVWLNNQTADCLRLFLMSCRAAFSSEEDVEALAETMQTLDDKLFRDAIKEMATDEQYRILQLCPEEYARKVVSSHFASTELFELYIGEQWEKLKSEIPYVAFDLETDGDTITEFAFRKEENTRVYQGEEQLSSLLRALKKTEIIVGHRIKEWDLGQVLSKKGFNSDAFVWDTLEIEILLNPCRYSYALHTTHTAKDDTEFVDRLFWNQLFRLSQDLDLCRELKDSLPSKINTILEELRQPVFVDFFKQSSGNDTGFYQVLYDTDEVIIEKLKLIEEEVKDDKTLIVAPKRLWARIAEHVNLSFPQQPEGLDFLSISKRLLDEKPVENLLINAILNRFLSLSRTPIVANIAQYLRLNYLPDNLLLNYVEQPECQIQCADLSVIVNVDLVKKFKRVYFIGCEIENRINQYVLPTQYSSSDFWSQNSSIPMRLGGSSYIAVTEEERKMPIFDEVPKDAANVWIERTRYGKYIINYNYDFYSTILR